MWLQYRRQPSLHVARLGPAYDSYHLIEEESYILLSNRMDSESSFHPIDLLLISNRIRSSSFVVIIHPSDIHLYLIHPTSTMMNLLAWWWIDWVCDNESQFWMNMEWLNVNSIFFHLDTIAIVMMNMVDNHYDWY